MLVRRFMANADLLQANPGSVADQIDADSRDQLFPSLSKFSLNAALRTLGRRTSHDAVFPLRMLVYIL